MKSTKLPSFSYSHHVQDGPCREVSQVGNLLQSAVQNPSVDAEHCAMTFHVGNGTNQTERVRHLRGTKSTYNDLKELDMPSKTSAERFVSLGAYDMELLTETNQNARLKFLGMIFKIRQTTIRVCLLYTYIERRLERFEKAPA